MRATQPSPAMNDTRGVDAGHTRRDTELSEAEARYLTEIAADCAAILGPGIELLGIELDKTRDFSLLVRYRLEATEATSNGSGETVVEAHAALRQRLIVDRARLGFTVLVRDRR